MAKGKSPKSDKKWWAQREKWVDEHYTDTPHIDKYIITVEIETSFAQENDGVRNAQEAREWLNHGDIFEIAEAVKIISVRKGG